MPGVQPGTPGQSVEDAKRSIPGKHSRLWGYQELFYLITYAILLSPQSCLNKELGQLQSHFTNKQTQDHCYWTLRKPAFLYSWWFYRGFLLHGMVISQAVSNSQDLLGITWTVSSLAWLFFSVQFYFLPSPPFPLHPFFSSSSSLPRILTEAWHFQRRLHPLSHPCYFPSLLSELTPLNQFYSYRKTWSPFDIFKSGPISPRYFPESFQMSAGLST